MKGCILVMVVAYVCFGCFLGDIFSVRLTWNVSFEFKA